MPKLIEINKRELARNYGLNRDTINKYCDKYVKDVKKASETEVKNLNKALDQIKSNEIEKTALKNAFSKLESKKGIKFEDGQSSTKQLLDDEREDYNFFVKLVDIDKQKVQSLEKTKRDSKEDATNYVIYKKELREDKKTLLAISNRIKELEKDLSLTNIEEYDPIDD